MKYGSIGKASIATGLMLTGLIGCGGDGVTPPKTTQANNQLPLQVMGNNKSSANGDSATPVKLAAPNIPEGAKFTIVCAQYGGGGHIAEAQAVKDRLVRSTGRNDFYVLHDDNLSTLYFGYYRAIERADDPAEAKRAEADQAFIRGMEDSSHHKLFPGSLKQPLPVADPEGPPEFDLTKLDRDKAPDDPGRRYWSIAIAAYTVDANPTGSDAGKSRKQLAVESVVAARKLGYEAYYYNGENVSTVCIGAWPRDAVAEQQSNEAKATGDRQTIFVSPAPLPQALTEQLENSGDGVKVFQPKIDIKDPSMLNIWKQFPTYSVNGREQINTITNPQTGVPASRPQQTFLVEIPRLKPSILSNTAPSNNDDAGPPTMINPLGPGSSGGSLRSVTK